MSPLFKKIVSYASMAAGGLFLYTSYISGMKYLPAPELPKQLYRRSAYEFAVTAKSPFFYVGLVAIAAGIILLIMSGKRSQGTPETEK